MLIEQRTWDILEEVETVVNEISEESPQMPQDEYFDNDPLNMFLAEIHDIKLLTPKEEMLKFTERDRLRNDTTISVSERQRKIKEIEDEIVKRNLRYVITIAKECKTKYNPKLDLIDLVQEGSMGAKRAVIKFDISRPSPKNPGQPMRYTTYATAWIWQAITKAIADSSPHAAQQFWESRKIKRAIAILHINFNAVSDEELDAISEMTEIDKNKVLEFIECDLYALSLDGKAYHRNEESELSLGDITADPIAINQEKITRKIDNNEVVVKFIDYLKKTDCLTEQERTVSLIYYSDFQEAALTMIAKKLELSRERIRQIRNSIQFKIEEDIKKNFSQNEQLNFIKLMFTAYVFNKKINSKKEKKEGQLEDVIERHFVKRIKELTQQTNKWDQ